MPLGMSPFDLLLPNGWFTAYLGGFVALPVLAFLAALVKVQGRRWRLPLRTPLPPAKIPSLFSRHGQPWIGRLGFLGYALQECSESADGLTWRMASTADQSVALLEGSTPSAGGQPGFRLKFITFLSDGRTIVTADGPTTPRPPAHWNLSQAYFKTIEAQILAHRAAVERERGSAVAVLPAPQALPDKLAAEDQAVFDALAASGDFAPGSADASVLHPTLGRLPAQTLRYLAGLFTGASYVSSRRRDIAPVPKSRQSDERDEGSDSASIRLSTEQLVERDISRFRELTVVAPCGKYRSKRLGILVATVMVVIAAVGRDAIPLTALKVMGILAFHELGHWIAMRCFGFTGMGKTFIPFIGPTELGRKLQAPAWQNLVVVLAGPVPGLLLGLAVLIAGFFIPVMPTALLNLAVLAVVINAFHLLPFLPLDGGKVVDLLLFRDLPILRPFFTSISATATVIASFASGSRILRYIAFGMFAGLAWDFKMIKVVRGGRRLGWAGGVDDETEALRRIFTGIRTEKNDAFLRSDDWFRQIDVLLGEVLRKRPKMATRFLGGAFYTAACLLPITLVAGVAALVFFSGMTGVSKQIEASMEFAEPFPHKPGTLADARLKPFEVLSEGTDKLIPESDDTAFSLSPAQQKEWAGKVAATLGPALDKMNWADAALANHQDLLENDHLSVWMDALCGKMESATNEGRHAEAARRAEVMLHAVSSMEPPLSQEQRELFRKSEVRALSSVEALVASGKLDAATLQRIEGRINQLNKAPLPEVENLLLVEGWATLQMKDAFGISESDEAPAAAAAVSSPDRLWKEAYRQVRSAVRGGIFKGNGTSATVALARHWKKSRKVGELPAEMAEAPSLASGEAEYIAAFCEGHRLATWRRLTALSAIRLEAYRQKAGKLPEKWEYALTGGAKLTLVQEKGPCLKLSDQRPAEQKVLPEWLGGGSLGEKEIEHLCPLHGAQVPELSRK